MNTLQKSLLVAVTAVCMHGSVLANDSHRMAARGMHTQPTLEQVQAHFAERLDKLHDKLNLQASQEAAWSAFATAMTPTSLPTRPDHADGDNLTAPERAQRRLDAFKQRESVLTGHVAAIKTVYAALSPEQQKIFDDNFKKLRRHHGPHRH